MLSDRSGWRTARALRLDGQVIVSGRGIFSSVVGLGNPTLGAELAATGARWGFVGTIDRVGVLAG